jgi:hypothetical protein
VTNLPSGGGTSQLLGLGSSLFACSPNNGIFLSTNLGSTWTRISTGLPVPNYQYSLAIMNGTMFAGTSGNSVWKRPLSDLVAVEEIPVFAPKEFALDQNYPNPFNPATYVSFAVGRSSYVTLKIYNILGEEVATLVNRELTAGTYRAFWNAAGLPSGVYYYRLQAGNNSDMKKMTLVR